MRNRIQHAAVTVLQSLIVGILCSVFAKSAGAGSILCAVVGTAGYALCMTMCYVGYFGVDKSKSFVCSQYKRWVTVCNVAALVVGLFCGGVSGGIALAVGANMIIVAVFAVAGFAGYARLAHNTFMGTTKVSDLFDFRR